MYELVRFVDGDFLDRCEDEAQAIECWHRTASASPAPNGGKRPNA